MQFYIKLAAEAQDAATKNDQRTLYACVRRLRKYKPPGAAILKAGDGSLVATHQESLSAQQSFVMERHAANAIRPCD